MSDYDRGDLAEVDLELRDLDGDLTDATTVSIEVKAPDGTITTHTLDEDGFISHNSVGLYSARITLPEVGRWDYRWTTDEPQSAEEGTLIVRRGRFDPDATDPYRPAWAPSGDDVAALIRARTKDRMGQEIGSWNENTRPTAAQVDLIIGQALTDVTDAIGRDDPCSDKLKTSAGKAAALKAAMRVELSFFPEQVGTANSPYNALRDEYKDKIAGLSSSVSRDCEDDDSDTPGSMSPNFAFDKPVADIGFGTIW